MIISLEKNLNKSEEPVGVLIFDQSCSVLTHQERIFTFSFLRRDATKIQLVLSCN